MKKTYKFKSSKTLTISLLINFLFVIMFGIIVYKKGGINFLTNKTSSKKYAIPHYIEKSEYDLLNNENKVVFFGDSLTQFGQWDELLNNKNVLNRGIENDTTEGLLDRITEVTKTKPQKVFIMIGINDLIAGNSVDKIITNYKKIINDIKENSSTTKIYVESILPIDEKLYEKNYPTQRKLDSNNIKEINNKLKEISDTQYINLYSVFMSNGGFDKYTVDGVHLNGQGYNIWQQSIKKYVDKQ